MLFRDEKRGQVAIFVILAVLIVGGIISYFVLRDKSSDLNIPKSLEPVFNQYTSCIEESLTLGLNVAGSQGGRLDVGDYIPGSEYAPFANHLNFLGIPVPYWYYVSGNGVIKENAPSKGEIELELSSFIESRIQDCDFDIFYSEGFNISSGEGREVKVLIEEDKASVEVEQSLAVSKGEDSAVRNNHKISVQSKFGSLYSEALNIYKSQREDAFLENYGVDVLRLYAPVDGVEIGCSPKIWKTSDVVSELKEGLVANIGALKLGGSYYQINDDDEYFVLDIPTKNAVNFLYSPDWPSQISIYGDGVDDDLIVAEPVGNQNGLGVMGFCYVPYHYVYDLSYPVLVQIYSGQELFQFPVVAVIDNNRPRVANLTYNEFLNENEFDFCEYYNQEIKVNLYDVSLNPVNGKISYQCFNQVCSLGETKNGVFEGNAPGCVNGYVIAKSEGYEDKTQLYSSNNEESVDIILDRQRETSVKLMTNGKTLSNGEEGVVSFSRGSNTVSAFIPGFENIKLSEGYYNVSAYVYDNSSILIPSSTKTECKEVPRSGLAGIFGSTEEKCFDITTPETKLEKVIIGGGSAEVYLFDSSLANGSVSIEFDRLERPSTLKELQDSLAIFATQKINVN